MSEDWTPESWDRHFQTWDPLFQESLTWSEYWHDRSAFESGIDMVLSGANIVFSLSVVATLLTEVSTTAPKICAAIALVCSIIILVLSTGFRRYESGRLRDEWWLLYLDLKVGADEISESELAYLKRRFASLKATHGKLHTREQAVANAQRAAEKKIFGY